MKRTIGASHLNIFKFIKELQGEQSYQNLRIAKSDKSEDPEHQQKKYVKLNERIVKIIRGYRDVDNGLMRYLLALAHNVIV